MKLLLVTLAAVTTAALGGPTPIVLWHGMGDSCCNPESMGRLKKVIEDNIDGVYVLSLKIGKDVLADTENGFLMNVNHQIEMACSIIGNDTNLANGYHSVGFSQGGQFLRAVAQRCPNPPMLNLVSVGGQHQGVNGFPHCPGDTTICNWVRKLLDMGAYIGWIQNTLVQAEYWHDPLKEAEYAEKSVFLADINNEKTINPAYKTNLLKLKNMVLIKFNADTMVVPRESEWFGFYKPGSTTEKLTMNQTKLYTEDRIGLKELDTSGRLHFHAFEGDHLRFSEQEFITEVINKYLKQ